MKDQTLKKLMNINDGYNSNSVILTKKIKQMYFNISTSNNLSSKEESFNSCQNYLALVKIIRKFKINQNKDSWEINLKSQTIDFDKSQGKNRFKIMKLFNFIRVLSFLNSHPPSSMKQQSDFYDLDAIIEELICPLTQELMKDPVTIESGHTYDRYFIQAWFNRENKTNPITGLPLKSLTLYPNISLRCIIQKMPKLNKKLNKRQKNISQMQQILKKIEQMWDKQSEKNASISKKEKSLLVKENEKLRQLIDKNEKLIDKLKYQLKKRMNEKKSYERQIQKLGQKLITLNNQISNPEQKQIKGSIASQFVDSQYSHRNRLFFDGRTITAKQWAHVFGKKRVMGQYTFTVRFSKIVDIVALGVTDTVNKNGQKNSNSVFYHNDGHCNACGVIKKIGSGFKHGDQVKVVIDLKEGSIQWLVGQQIRHQQGVEILKNSGIIWVPYICLPNKEDSVQIKEG